MTVLHYELYTVQYANTQITTAVLGGFVREYIDLFKKRRNPFVNLQKSFMYALLRHNIDRTVMLNGLISETMAGWIAEGVLSQENFYGMGILNEPHICGTWRDDGKWWPVCRDDYYPKGE